MPSEDAAALCERLSRGFEDAGEFTVVVDKDDLTSALALIARLTAERDRLRTALVPFVEFGQSALAEAAGVWLNGESIPAVTWQFARAALAPAPAEGESDA